MDKGVKKVRKSIERRKRIRGPVVKGGQAKKVYPSFPQEEEKHGYYPFFADTDSSGSRTGSMVTGFVLKGMLSVMLFLGVALLHQSNSEILSEPKAWTSNALTEDFPFAQVHQWYQETFGNPLAFSPEYTTTNNVSDALALPVNGSIAESFQSNGKGIMITPGEATDVSTLSEGIVIFAGNDKETNKTVVVQHADGTTSSYGYLSDINVHLYQFVVNNQPIGTFHPTVDNEDFYFAIEKDNEFIDPVQVIQVDEQQ
ncbi:peptidoglycan DD-metalloendopeptidase family protein [Oceanobacillus halophilus]|uniref:M23 family peptidase n=1 Tax=Oceanobacillus halophilus TaxID=930130 RepID=A0A495AEE5_9BACI|nr:peptidoglycan DD-metalloendopeptidase family protein [Oceanobacillus halophilus]RKQ37910.1 M23 family peptidase [Oceanobacillus halophilus]